MASGLSMKVLLSLQAKQFDKGINSVKKSLGGLKNTVLGLAGTIAGGLGFRELLKNFTDTSTKISTLQATLRNVSSGFKEYAESMQFLKEISNTYGQDLMSLVDGFAKFRASAKDTKLTLDQQRDIFEALTQASGAFHLSAEQNSNVMLAITQMFSKGKITAEELRRQLSNTLPGAFNLMAKAAQLAGVSANGTTKELEDLMKQGKLLTEDVMPSFAQVLKAATMGADFDSLQSELNRFKNAWVEFVDKTSFGDMFKSFVVAGTNALKNLTENFNSFKANLFGLGAAIVGAISFKNISKHATSELNSINTEIEASKGQLLQLKKELNSLGDEYERVGTSKSDGEFKLKFGSKQAAMQSGININDLVEEKTIIDGIETTTYRLLNKNEKLARIEEEIVANKQQQENVEARINALQEQSNKKMGVMRTIGLGMKNIFKSIGGAITGMISSMAVGAVLGLLTNIVTRIADVVKFNRQLKNQTNEVLRSVQRVSDATAAQLAKAKTLAEYARQESNDERKRGEYLSRLNDLLGKTGKDMLTIKSTAEDIDKAIKNWEEDILKTAKASAYFSKIQELTAKNIDLKSENTTLEPITGETTTISQASTYGIAQTYQSYTSRAFKAQNTIKRNNQQIEANVRTIDALLKEVEKEGLSDPFDKNKNGDGGVNNDTLDELKKALNKYRTSLIELNNQRQNGALSEKEYQDELAKTVESNWKAIASFSDLEYGLELLGDEYKTLANHLKSDFAMNQIAAKVKNQFDKINKVIENEVDTIASEVKNQFDEINKTIDKEVDDLLKKSNEVGGKELNAGVIPKKGTRDTFFDYKKDDKDILSEKASISENYVSALEKYRNALIDIQGEYGKLDSYGQHALQTVISLLAQAKKEAKDLRSQAQIAEWIEDVKKLKDAYKNELLNSLTSTSSALGSMASSTHQLAEAIATLGGGEIGEGMQDFFNKLDAVVGILNTLIQTINTVNTVIEAMAKVRKAYQAVEKASAIQEQSDIITTIGLKNAETIEEGKSAVATVVGEKTKQAEIATTTKMHAGEAVAGAAASQAGIPFVGPILAAAAVAAIIALITAGMSKFANGGIVGGSSTQGDNNVVRANSGEMILNKGQQGTLYKAISNGSLGGGNVEFKLRGTDLIGAINNTQKKMRGI